MEDGENHAAWAVALLALDLLPHDAADSYIGHKDNVRRLLHVNGLLSHDLHIVIIQAFAVVGGIIYALDHFQRLADLCNVHIGAVQILQHIVSRKNRAEGGNAPVGDLVGLGEQVFQLKVYPFHRVLLQSHGLSRSDISPCLFL